MKYQEQQQTATGLAGHTQDTGRTGGGGGDNDLRDL